MGAKNARIISNMGEIAFKNYKINAFYAIIILNKVYEIMLHPINFILINNFLKFIFMTIYWKLFFKFL